MAALKPARPEQSVPANKQPRQQYTELDPANDENGQLTFPEICAVPTVFNTGSRAPKQTMQYDYIDTPVVPTGRQNRFVLAKLKETAAGYTTVELTAMGVVDPRPRIRDLRELGWRIETIQDGPHDVGRYVLMTGKGEL